MKPFRLAFPTLCLVTLASAASFVGCGDVTPSTTSPIVSADSEQGKKALAEDDKERQIRKQKEAKAAARNRRAKLPDEG